MEMIKVSSSNVDSVGYDNDSSLLYVRFTSGALYTYVSVPIFEFEGLINAPSIGTYLNRNIKGAYAYQRIE